MHAAEMWRWVNEAQHGGTRHHPAYHRAHMQRIPICLESADGEAHSIAIYSTRAGVYVGYGSRCASQQCDTRKSASESVCIVYITSIAFTRIRIIIAIRYAKPRRL